MAGGNLPALARTSQLEVLIMSRSSDFSIFEKYPAFRIMKNTMKVNFVPIDDLIPGNIYGITLTLAYARPILALGRRMLEYHFVFMNGDFILADGSLKTLGRALNSGAKVVMAPSLRVIAEKTENIFFQKVQKGVLEIKPREFLKMSLPHLHPTTLGKMINFRDYHTIHPNQLFWKVDDNTLLGKYFLIFMLAIKPQRVVHKINSWCDYGFVPEFCPQIPIKVFGESDEFLMIETQEKDKEKELLRHGPLEVGSTQKSLSEWLTPGHLRNFQHEVLFHAGELPLKLSKAQMDFNSFISKVNLQKVTLKKYANHFYWKSGLRCWLDKRLENQIFQIPQELSSGNKLNAWIQGIRRKMSTICSRNQAYSWSDEELIMEPRLALLEEKLKKNVILADHKMIIVDQNTLISVICLLRRILKNKKTEISLVVLSKDPQTNRSILSKFKKSKEQIFITSDFPSAANCKLLKIKSRNALFFLLPEKQYQNIQVDKALVELRFLEFNHKITKESVPDKSFWLLKKTFHFFKSISIDPKEVAKKSLLRILFGDSLTLPEKRFNKWKVRIPYEFLAEIQEGALTASLQARNRALKTRTLRLGSNLVHLTCPYSDEDILFPRIRIPLLYRLNSILNRLLYENNLLEKQRRQAPKISGTISSQAALCVIRLRRERPFS